MLLAIGSGPHAASAATYTWNATQSVSGPSDGSGTWNTTTTNWWNGSSNIAWPNLSGASADIAAFGTGSGTGGTVTLSTASTLNVAGLQFNATSSSFFTLSSGTVAIADSGTIALADNSRSPVITSVVTGSNITVAKLGATASANVSLNGNNRLTGTTTISGTLSTATFGLSVTAGHTNAFGTSAIVVESGAMFLPNVSGTFANNLFISGSGIGGTRGAIRQEVGGAVTLSGSITMTGDASINSYGGNRVLTLSGPIAESGATPRSLALITQTPGTDQNTFILTAASTYTGSTSITGVTVRLSGGNDRLPAATRVAIGGSGNGRLVLGGNSQTLAGLSMLTGGTGFVVGGTTTTSALVLNIASGTSTFAGTIGGTATNDNNLTLTKRGAGTFSLTGTNTLTGATSVEAGTLALGSANPLPNSTVALSSGATLRMDASSTVNFSGPGNVQLGGNVLTTGTDNISRTYDGVISGTAGSGFVKVGTGTTTLTGANTLTGTLTAGQGVLTIGSVGTTATANPLGRGTVGLGSGTFVGTLRYTGASGTANHAIVLSGSSGGGVIEANGTGGLVLAGPVTTSGGTKSFTLGGSNSGDNSIGLIADPSNPVSSTQLIKSGAGRWILTSGSSTFVGGVVIQQGELVVNADTDSANFGSLGYKGAGYNVTVGSANGAGTAALLLKDGVTVRNRSVNVTGSAGQVVILGGAVGSGTATFDASGNGNNPVTINLDHDVTLQAKSGGTVVFSGSWAFDTSGSAKAITIGSPGNAGTVRLDSPLGTTGQFLVQAGTLSVNGSTLNASIPSASGVTVASGAILGGSGRITSNIGGDGLVAPGNSPGILQVDGQVIPTGSTSFAFELTQTGDPTWSNATASANDVLRLTNASPFQSPLTTTNVVSVYFDVASLTSGDIFRGGFYSDKTSGNLNFAGAIGSPTYAFFVYGSGGGGTNYNGKNYFTLAQYMAANPSVTGITTSVVTVGSADYANGTITNGQVTQFVVVPEPATLALAAVGIGLGGWAVLRLRKR